MLSKYKVNGISLAYERRGKGKQFVLVHGYPLDHSIWEAVASRLENDFDLILPDLRGFGESDSAPGKPSMDDYAKDLAGMLDQLGIQKAVIAGHSMGGYVALAFARNFPGRVQGLGLVSSQTLADTPERKTGRYQEAEQVLAHGVKEVALAMSVKLTANLTLQGTLKQLIMRQKPDGLAGALQAMADRPDSTGQLSKAAYPIVLVHGLADGLIPVARARELKAAVPSVKLVEIPEAGHVPMMEAADLTANALKAFL